MDNRSSTNPLKTAALILWTLLPCLAMWVGLYKLSSAFWAYVIYHLLCVMPAILWGRKLWLPTFARPSLRHVGLLIAAAIPFGAVTVIGYEINGAMLLSDENVAVLLKELGINRNSFLTFALYSVLVNPLLEELYWRGVVLNELDTAAHINIKHFGIIWSSLAYALFHYLIFRLVLYPGWAEIGTLLLAVYGAILALIYRKSGSILTTALAHGILTDLACVFLLIDYFRKYPLQ